MDTGMIVQNGVSGTGQRKVQNVHQQKQQGKIVSIYCPCCAGQKASGQQTVLQHTQTQTQSSEKGFWGRLWDGTCDFFSTIGKGIGCLAKGAANLVGGTFCFAGGLLSSIAAGMGGCGMGFGMGMGMGMPMPMGMCYSGGFMPYPSMFGGYGRVNVNVTKSYNPVVVGHGCCQPMPRPMHMHHGPMPGHRWH